MIKEVGKNKYRFIVSVGGRDDRRRFTKTITHKGGKKALQALYDEYEAECRDMPSTEITVRQLLEAYIAHMEVLGRKQTTIRGYRIASERLYPLIGEILARNLTTAQLEEKIALMARNGLGAKTIKNSIGLLSAAYKHSIYIGQLKENPCVRATLPKGQPREVRIFFANEIKDFLAAIQDVDLNEKVAYELALFLGLRRSEILGLKESDVDIVNGLISIHSTRHRVDGEDVDQDTKTRQSTRVLALPNVLLIDLARLLQIHREFPYEKVDYLIQDGFGNAINPQTLSSRLVRLEDDKGLPHVTLHGLRHTYASLLHSKGVDMAMISRELGHSNLATTMNIYTHILQSATNASRGIANTIDSFASENEIGGTNVAQIENKEALER